MKRALVLAAGVVAVAMPAAAQLPPGSIGNGGRMPETMTPGALAPPPLPASPVQTITPSSPSPSTSSSVGRYPDTQTLSRDRIESQGYRVRDMNRQLDGSWKADVTRDAVPTRPKGVPSKVTIYPDGRIVEER